MTFKCIIFFKKSKMRFGHYLLHFRPFWTSKSDLKIVQKSIKNRPGNKHWILQSFELHFFTSKWEHNEKRSKKGSQNSGGKMVARVTWRPLWPKEDPRWTPDGPQKFQSGRADPKMTSKWVQNASKMTSAGLIFGLKRSCHFRFLCKKWREFCLGKEDLSEGKWPHSTQ